MANTEPEASASGRSVGEELRRLRGDMSLREFAQRVHFSPGHISNVENGTKPATEDFVRACDTALETGGRLAAVLAQSPPRTAHRKTAKPAQLPACPRLIGRVDMLRRLDGLLHHSEQTASARVISLDGQAGVGKTTLAVAWAHSVKHHFTDGAFFADLRGYAAFGDPADPSDVLEDMLTALGVSSAELPPTVERRAALMRTMLDGARMLVLLDNAAHVEQVRPLIPAAPGCLVVVTSRRRLSGLAVHHGAHCLTVEAFPPADSLALLGEVISPDRVEAERHAAERIIRFCSGLPLAVRVAAERIASSRHLTVTNLADDLSEVDKRLDVLSPYDADEAVRAVFSWSYKALEPDAAHLFRLLSLHPGREFGVDSAAALSGYDHARTARLLDILSGVHLLHEAALNRFRFHDLLWAYASERAAAEEPRERACEATRRLLVWYLHAAAAANRVISPHRPQAPLPPTPEPDRLPTFASADAAIQWCETELANLAAANQHAIARGQQAVAFGLPMVMADYLFRRNPWSTWLAPLQDALTEARRCGDFSAQAWVLNTLGNAHLAQHRVTEASRCFGEALEISQRIGDSNSEVWSHIGLGRTRQTLGEHEVATGHYRRSQAICQELGNQWSWAIATAYLGDASRALGDSDAALQHLEQAIDILRELRDHQAESCALEKISAVHQGMGRGDTALEYLDRALASSCLAADRWGQAELLSKMGHLHLKLGDVERARRAWEDALLLFEALGDARSTDICHDLQALACLVTSSPRQDG